jgi:hypothetical protein
VSPRRYDGVVLIPAAGKWLQTQAHQLQAAVPPDVDHRSLHSLAAESLTTAAVGGNMLAGVRFVTFSQKHSGHVSFLPGA